MVEAGYLERVSSVDDAAPEMDGGVFFSKDDLFKRGRLGREMLASYGADAEDSRHWSNADDAESASAETRSIGGRSAGGVTTLHRGMDGTVVG